MARIRQLVLADSTSYTLPDSTESPVVERQDDVSTIKFPRGGSYSVTRHIATNISVKGQLYAKSDALMRTAIDTLAKTYQNARKFYWDSDRYMTIKPRPGGYSAPYLNGSGQTVIDFDLRWVSEGLYWFADAESSYTGASVTAVNTGTVGVNPTFTVTATGSLTKVVITLGTKVMTFNLTMATGDVLKVDCANETAFITLATPGAGGSIINAFQYLTLTNMTLISDMKYEPGNSTVATTGSVGDFTFNSKHRDAWLP